MSSHRHIDKICLAAALLSLLLTLAFANGAALGLQPAAAAMGYETRLFDSGRVHTVHIVMDGWEDFLETCENEEYTACTLVIDGERRQNVAIRAKGNTSLRSVSALGSQRYSFKVEFDHYDSCLDYYGLDKLSLNNLIQDNTCMKDYLAYTLMGSFGVNAPLCSYVYLTVNGEDWGLYLAVEGVEDGFLQRNYGGSHGSLYKPDSASLGAGPGNGRGFDPEGMQELAVRPGGARREDETPPGQPGAGGMGSADVKLQYIDDDPESYPNIFNNAKTAVTQAGQERLIRALKALSTGEGLEQALDVEQVLRYFVVHNFLCNGDSYTGTMVHNYYLYEQDGRLAMIPWDYNLAFGTFQAGDASGAVNSPIDTPAAMAEAGDRPMVEWIFSDERYTGLYHRYFADFLAQADFEGLIDAAAELISPYVEKDPTKFCTWEEYQAGTEALRAFCRLRSQSVAGQLEGSIPATAAGQAADPSGLVDAAQLDLADMGSMEDAMGGPEGGEGPQQAPAGAFTPPGGGAGSPEGTGQGPAEGGFPAQEAGGAGNGQDPPGGSPPAQGGLSRSGGGEPAVLLALSAAVLAGGLAAAFLFRRK